VSKQHGVGVLHNAVCDGWSAQAAQMALVLLCAMQVVLSTHAISALSMFDFIVAAKLDVLPVEYSPKWLKENQRAVATTAQPAATSASAAATKS